MGDESNSGIRLDRSFLDRLNFNDSEYIHIYLYCLLQANHSNNEIKIHGKITKLKPGQFITNRKKIAVMLGINEHKIQRALTFLEAENLIKQHIDNKKRVISIINWDKFQITSQLNNIESKEKTETNVNKKIVPVHGLQKFIAENEMFINIRKLPKQLTEKEAIRISKNYSKKQIINTLMAMENYKQLTNRYVSVGLTLEKWLMKEYGHQQNII